MASADRSTVIGERFITLFLWELAFNTSAIYKFHTDFVILNDPRAIYQMKEVRILGSRVKNPGRHVRKGRITALVMSPGY